MANIQKIDVGAALRNAQTEVAIEGEAERKRIIDKIAREQAEEEKQQRELQAAQEAEARQLGLEKEKLRDMTQGLFDALRALPFGTPIEHNGGRFPNAEPMKYSKRYECLIINMGLEVPPAFSFSERDYMRRLGWREGERVRARLMVQRREVCTHYKGYRIYNNYHLLTLIARVNGDVEMDTSSESDGGERILHVNFKGCVVSSFVAAANRTENQQDVLQRILTQLVRNSVTFRDDPAQPAEPKGNTKASGSKTGRPELA